MLDFLKVNHRRLKDGTLEIFPSFIATQSNDLMVRGKDFYCIWDDKAGLWSKEETTAIRLIDSELYSYANTKKDTDENIIVKTLIDCDSGMIDKWHKYVQNQLRENFHALDETLIFSNMPTRKEDYASHRLSYPLEKGDISAYDEMMGVLYSPEERHKLEWAIGAIVSGDSKIIQKFIVLYGAPGTGKSTFLNIVQQLFDGYYSTFDSRALGSASNAFALEAFKTNPLIAIQHDGDLSRIEDNTRLNSLVSHEYMSVNEKFKATYVQRFNSFLFMGSNKPVKISDAKSGILRRLIDVTPTGNKLPANRYRELNKEIQFELGAIAYHCLQVYKNDIYYYDSYVPKSMMSETNSFYNFVLDSYETFYKEDSTTLTAAWAMYKEYCEDSNVPFPYSKMIFKEELKNYFRTFEERTRIDGERIRNYYQGFKTDIFVSETEIKNISNKSTEAVQEFNSKFIFKEQPSIFDKEFSDCIAQYASNAETPMKKWADVKTTLAAINTSEIHYVKVPEHHIVIDFDIQDENGNKDFQKNLEAASHWPLTYAELSKSGSGIHLHYNYAGNTEDLSRIFADNIEIKTFPGNSSLRRKLTKCNDVPIATLTSGLPLRETKKMINIDITYNEKAIRTLVKKNIEKQYHPGTKPSIEFIKKILDDAYEQNVVYDITDLMSDVLIFAAGSTHHSEYCIKLVNNMHFKSKDELIFESTDEVNEPEDSLVFFDVEVFPNLFLVNWKKEGKGKPIIRWINPKPIDIERLLKFKLVGFNNRKYDNHMLYACLQGYDNNELFQLSNTLINNKQAHSEFGAAYNLSYADIYDYCSKKQSLKKWEIELGITHMELGLPWNEPVPEELWDKVSEYCDNDVLATEAVFNARYQDFSARLMLAKLSGLSVNDTNRMHTTKIIFGNEKHPKLVYTDLSTKFPGYSYDYGVSTYRGENPGEGGYVFAIPGMYGDVPVLDVESMHPTSIEILNLFGEYTQRFSDIVSARRFIKHGEFEKAGELMGGALKPFLKDEAKAKELAQALKIVINSVYGYTTASFDNPFRDIRNKDNIVAKHGALFMINLRHEVEDRGYKVAHIKTDSIKIPDADDYIRNFVMDYGKQYGYKFDIEDEYEKFCLVNDAVYIAKEKSGKWTATGTQFAVPYVFKTLFSKENYTFDDFCETKSATTDIYLDFNEFLPDVSKYEKVKEVREKISKNLKSITKKELRLAESYKDISEEELDKLIATGHNYRFVGKVGRFTPVVSGTNGGTLYRLKDGKYYAVGGTSGYRWKESENVKANDLEKDIDMSYYHKLADEAVHDISQFGDFELFVSDTPYVKGMFDR